MYSGLNKTILIFIALFSLFRGFAQDNTEREVYIDSLKKVVRSEVHDTLVVQALTEWGNLIYSYDPDLDFELNLQVDSLCGENLSQKLSLDERLFFLRSKSAARNNIGSSQMRKGEFKEALDSYNQSLSIRRKLKDKEGEARTLLNIGVLQQGQGNNGSAISSYVLAFQLQEQLLDSAAMAKSLNNIGLVYEASEDYEKASEYYHRSLDVLLASGNTSGAASVYNNLGNLFRLEEESDSALFYLNKSLNISLSANDLRGVALNYLSIGALYEQLEDYEKALSYFEKGRASFQELGYLRQQSNAIVQIASVYLKKKQLDFAIREFSTAFDMAMEIGAKNEIASASRGLYLAYKSKGISEKALYYYEIYHSYKRQIDSEANQKEIIQQEFKYSYEKQAAADSIRNADEKRIHEAELLTQKVENKRQKDQSYFLYGGLALTLLFSLFIWNRFRFAQRQKKIIFDQKQLVDQAFDQLEEKNKEMVDSINYAERIQRAVIPEEHRMRSVLPKSFVYYNPKDVLSGDFYWVYNVVTNDDVDLKLFAVGDCTGHGIPGAMLSILGINYLNLGAVSADINSTGEALDYLNDGIVSTFGHSSETIRDGMDIVLGALNTANLELYYSCAKNPIYIVRNKEIIPLKGEKKAIGNDDYDEGFKFSVGKFQLEKGDMIYTFSDGYQDQFGGESGKKYKVKKLKEFFCRLADEPLADQENLMKEEFQSWLGDYEQIDDVTVMGIRI